VAEEVEKKVGTEVTEVGMEVTEEETVVTAVVMEAIMVVVADVEATKEMEIMEATMVDMETMEVMEVTEMITTKNADAMKVLAAAAAMTMNGTPYPVAGDAESAEKVAKHAVLHNEKNCCEKSEFLLH
jgi:hypothetical protein